MVVMETHPRTLPSLSTLTFYLSKTLNLTARTKKGSRLKGSLLRRGSADHEGELGCKEEGGWEDKVREAGWEGEEELVR